MDLEVDTDGLREAARLLAAAETGLRLPSCVDLALADDALGPSPVGRQAAGLLLRRAQQSVEAVGLLADSAADLVWALAQSADVFDRLEAVLAGPR